MVELGADEFGGLPVTQGAIMNMGSFSSFCCFSSGMVFLDVPRGFISTLWPTFGTVFRLCAGASWGRCFLALQVTTCAWRSCWKKRFSTRPKATPSARSTAQCKDPSGDQQRRKDRTSELIKHLPLPLPLLLSAGSTTMKAPPRCS